ncbi:pseudouridine synthase [Vibrio sp. V27_P1S3P104]|nr:MULTISPECIES: YqcC family protein [Vibrio]NAW68393.1 pseudouridine synthase [Vibrio sp. V28_P6S34P95]NAX05499.1 pseudouridine synthase [Vibrio sp. V30_P3S12P165]NAX33894.1 pseudouridine synthase [Vibrio sp. V29_P1S30P107]NAX38204.1 pseudouridine synthase [Vibrio sp. V27_P1S3P104]NNN44214.1 YqcC family protein [Vibrio sp. 1-1(7)]
MTHLIPFSALLTALEKELKAAALWQHQKPKVHYLQSKEPFSLDILHPHEWLQWIFLPRMQQLLADNAPLPQGFLLTPYFVEVWQEQPQYQAILNVLHQIDKAVASC